MPGKRRPKNVAGVVATCIELSTVTSSYMEGEWGGCAYRQVGGEVGPWKAPRQRPAPPQC